MSWWCLRSAAAGDGRTSGPALSRAALAFGTLVLAAGATSACGNLASSEGEPDQAALAGAEVAPTSPPRSREDVQITPEPTGGPTPQAGRPWSAEVSAVCADAVGAGFHQEAQSADDGGATTFWVRGADWRVCDLAAAAAEPTVFGPARERPGTDRSEFALSLTPVGDDAGDVRLVAGGELARSVDEIRYDLPDGARVRARFVTAAGDEGRTFWVMTHRTAASTLEPGSEPVTVSVTGAAAEAFRMPWEQIRRDG